MKLKLCLLFMLFPVLTVWADKRSLNNGWDFIQLTNERGTWEIKNQGSDWSTQFNVEHVSEEAHALTIPADTLTGEFEQLKNRHWERVNLPHTANIEELTITHPWQGICYYRRELKINPSDVDQQLWIEFEGAMQLTDVWINGKHVMQHAGGYTPFVIDATGILKAGQSNEILVRLDNRDNKLIPPGKPLSSLDFCYHSGIYRDVNLIVKPAVHITNPILAHKTAGGGIFVTYPRVSPDASLVEVRTEVANRSAADQHLNLRQTLLTRKGKKGTGKAVAQVIASLNLTAGSSSSTTQQLEVAHPALWSPESPNLYLLRTEILDGKKVIDCEETRIGIRRFEVSREKGVLINGKPVRLVGTNRHMEYPYVGNAISDNAQYRDMFQIRNNGFNIVRLGHYPQDPSVLDACDELGLLVIEPIPGWQFFNRNPIFTGLTFETIRETIRRDRNHPSILMWETTLNESWPPKEWKDEAVATAHAEMPGDQCFTSGDTYGYEGFDICYNDWDDATFGRPNNSHKPSFIREYYDYEFGGHYSTTRITRGDGERALLQNLWNAQWSHNRNRTYYPATTGDAVWSMYDYNRGCCDNICYSGTADLFRLPKFSLSFFRTQQAAGSFTPAGPMPHELFVASYWMPDSPDTVKIYGNVDEVELRIDGHTVARKTADNGPNTPYHAQAEADNCRELTYPPFTFTNIKPGTGLLEAIGYCKGEKVTSCTVHTPGQSARLSIDYFESGRPATINDLLIVYVRLEDAIGTLCPVNGEEVSLQVEGGTIIGPATYKTEAGIASFLVQTANAPKLKLTASAGYLKAQKALRCAHR